MYDRVLSFRWGKERRLRKKILPVTARYLDKLGEHHPNTMRIQKREEMTKYRAIQMHIKCALSNWVVPMHFPIFQSLWPTFLPLWIFRISLMVLNESDGNRGPRQTINGKPGKTFLVAESLGTKHDALSCRRPKDRIATETNCWRGWFRWMKGRCNQMFWDGRNS